MADSPKLHYANGEAAALLGPRFVAQDALHKAFNVDGAQTPDRQVR